MPEIGLSEQEGIVLEAIRRAPFATQAELAEQCGLSRPTIATYVSHLVRKGYLLGRAYILADRRQILCIGGATIDRKYQLTAPLIRDSSNPATGHATPGGVARNVAENLARFDSSVSLISVIGDDEGGRAIEAGLRTAGVETVGLTTVRERETAEYFAVLDPDGALAFGIVNSAIFDLITPAMLETLRPRLLASRIVFAECNLPEESLIWLAARRAEDGFLLAVNTISVAKSRRVAAILGGIDLLFTNRAEAETLTGLDGASPEALVAALARCGVGRVVVTTGGEGLVHGGAGLPIEHVPAVSTSVLDVTGAGDALVAGVLDAYESDDFRTACRRGLAAAAIVAASPHSVCPIDTQERIAAYLSVRAAPKRREPRSKEHVRS